MGCREETPEPGPGPVSCHCLADLQKSSATTQTSIGHTRVLDIHHPLNIAYKFALSDLSLWRQTIWLIELHVKSSKALMTQSF